MITIKKSTTLVMFAVAVALMASSCAKNGTETSETTDTTDSSQTVVDATKHVVDPVASSVNWLGEMLSMYTHEGTVAVQSGDVLVAGNQLVGGSVSIDLTKIVPTDTRYEDKPGRSKADLIGHLSSPDFFDVTNHPTATFTLNEVNGNTGKGTLNLRGTQGTENVTNLSFQETETGYKVSGDVTFDRKKYGAMFDMTIPDMILSNDIKIHFDLAANK